MIHGTISWTSSVTKFSSYVCHCTLQQSSPDLKVLACSTYLSHWHFPSFVHLFHKTAWEICHFSRHDYKIFLDNCWPHSIAACRHSFEQFLFFSYYRWQIAYLYWLCWLIFWNTKRHQICWKILIELKRMNCYQVFEKSRDFFENLSWHRSACFLLWYLLACSFEYWNKCSDDFPFFESGPTDSFLESFSILMQFAYLYSPTLFGGQA